MSTPVTSNFRSDINFLKRAVVDSTTLAAPSTAYGASLYVTNYTVAHGLGYSPAFQVYYRPHTDGVLWPPVDNRRNLNQVNPEGGTAGPGLVAWSDSTNLNLQLFYDTNALGRTTEVFWIIYGDFALIP